MQSSDQSHDPGEGIQMIEKLEILLQLYNNNPFAIMDYIKSIN